MELTPTGNPPLQAATDKPAAPTYPEHEKMAEVKEISQAIGDFLRWLEDAKGWVVAVPHAHTDECYTMGFNPKNFRAEYGAAGSGIASDTEAQAGRFKTAQCHLGAGHLLRANFTVEKLLAEHLGIDLVEIEKEKRAMLETIRNTHAQ